MGYVSGGTGHRQPLVHFPIHANEPDDRNAQIINDSCSFSSHVIVVVVDPVTRTSVCWEPDLRSINLRCFHGGYSSGKAY
jgi:hypothetical protein